MFGRVSKWDASLFLTSKWDASLFLTQHPDISRKIMQLYGDSATYDFGTLIGRVDFVFVDGCHTHDYVLRDTLTAYAVLAPSGIIAWHDYDSWPDVTRLLNQLDAWLPLNCRLTRVESTHLVFHAVWQ